MKRLISKIINNIYFQISYISLGISMLLGYSFYFDKNFPIIISLYFIPFLYRKLYVKTDSNIISEKLYKLKEDKKRIKIYSNQMKKIYEERIGISHNDIIERCKIINNDLFKDY